MTRQVALRTYAFSELDGVSRLLLVGDPSTTLDQRLENLGLAGLLSHEQSFHDMFKLPAGVAIENEEVLKKVEVPPGWRRLGMLATKGGIGVQREGVRAQASSDFWILCYDWNPRVGKTAWEIMLYTQDTLRPQGWSLQPQYVLPLIYLARMGDYPLRPDSNRQGRWIPHLAYAYEQTYRLLEALFSLRVVEGKGKKAGQMRSMLPPHARRLPPDLKPVVKRVSALFGDARVDTILNAERPEPAIIRTLNETSAELWSGSVAGVSPKDTWIPGLLLLALWHPEPTSPADEVARLLPEQIAQGWEQFVKGK